MAKGPASSSHIVGPRPHLLAATPIPSGIRLPASPDTFSSASTLPLRPGIAA